MLGLRLHGVEGWYDDLWHRRDARERVVGLLDDLRWRFHRRVDMEAETSQPREGSDDWDEEEFLHGSRVTLCFSTGMTLAVAFTT